MTSRVDGRRIVLIVAGCLMAALLAVATVGPSAPVRERPMQGTIRAYRTATGIFALPAAGSTPVEFAEAEAAAAATGNAVAFSVWTEQRAFETQVWRDVLYAGRTPIARPPQVDFAREVAILAWPAAHGPPAAQERLARAPALQVVGTSLRGHGLEVKIAPETGGPAPALPAVSGARIAPYIVITIPRQAWPLPAPAPAVPPLVVTLAE